MCNIHMRVSHSVAQPAAVWKSFCLYSTCPNVQSWTAPMSHIFKDVSRFPKNLPTAALRLHLISWLLSQRHRTPCCCTMSYWNGRTGRSESSSTTPCRASGKEKSICISPSSRTSTGGRWAWTHIFVSSFLYICSTLLTVKQKQEKGHIDINKLISSIAFM